MADIIPTHAHSVIDTARPFTIDPNTKEVRPGTDKLTLAQRSQNSERFTFTISGTTIEGHDMTVCNSVMIHFQNIDQDRTQRSIGIYKVTDLAVKDNTVTLSWLIGEEATLYAGSLIFSIHFTCTDDLGNVLYNFPTLTFSKVTVGATVWNSETIEKECPDIIAEFEARLAAAEDQLANGSVGSAVLYTPQNLTPEEQSRARENMRAASIEDIPTKPEDIGALPSTYTPPNQTAAQVGADPKGTAASAVSQHNTADDSHNDIRLELKAIKDRLTAFFDSDNQTLDEMSEIVSYITSNKTLIDSITTSKVSVADIINNLVTNVANKPLSAAQGVELKTLIDAITVPTKVSQLQNDAGYLTQHQDISGKLDASKLPEAINTALAQAQNSGVFDGKNGRGIKSIIRTAGTGAAGTTDTYTVTYTDNTTSTISVYNGKDGTNGTNVTVSSVTESTEDGGSNVVTFSDGKTLSVKNGRKGRPGVDGKDYSFDPTVYGLPILQLTGDTSPIAVNKDNKVALSYVYGERSGTCTLKGQGATSYKKAQALVNAGKAGKFNYTINFDTAFEAATGWGSQKKYCLKANWIDHSHSRNVVSAKLWGMIVKSRSTANANLSGLVNGGAVDGFPIVIMLNGEFHGLYTFNIPKDGWMMGMVESTTKQQALLGANDHEVATQFKGELAGDESDFELEFVSDEDNADWVTPSLNRCINACINSWGGDLDTEVTKYLDWDSAIDYYIWVVVCKGTDMVDKNYLLSTFDGTKWHFTAYDMDSTYGLNWDGSGLTRAVSNINFEECAATHRVYELIKRFKTNALKARYNELRSNVLSETRICQLFENFAWAMPSPVLLEDVKLYPTILGSGVNGIDQICRWVRQRLEACDKWANALPAQETPVEPEEPEKMVNQVPISTDTDGSIYNGTGYKDNTRLSSSGGVSGTAQNGSVVTGFIPYEFGDVIRMKGATWLGNASNGHWYINFYRPDKTLVTNAAIPVMSYESGTYNGHLSVVYDATTNVTTFSLDNPDATTGLTQYLKSENAAFFRLNAKGNGADLIVTVNQEIT